MHLDARAVQRHRLNPDSHHLLALKFFEHFVQHASLRPNLTLTQTFIHGLVNRVEQVADDSSLTGFDLCAEVHSG